MCLDNENCLPTSVPQYKRLFFDDPITKHREPFKIREKFLDATNKRKEK